MREGRSNGEIARELGISPDGAKFHVSEIITKLGVATRREAAQWDGAPAAVHPVPSARLRLGGHPSLRRRGRRSRRYERRIARSLEVAA